MIWGLTTLWNNLFFLEYLFLIMVKIMWDIPFSRKKKPTKNVDIYLYGNVFPFWLTNKCLNLLFLHVYCTYIFCCFIYFKTLMENYIDLYKLFLIKFYNTLMLLPIIAYCLADIYEFVGFFVIVTGKWESNNTAQYLECWKDVNFCFLSPRVLLCPIVKRNVPALLISANVLVSFMHFSTCLFLIKILVNSFYRYFEMIP